MPKQRQEARQICQKYVNEFSILKYQDKKLFCTLCIKYVNHEKRSFVIQHINSKCHKNKAAEGRKQTSMTEMLRIDDEKSVFYERLTEAFLAADIPLHKLENSIFKEFLERYMNYDMPHPSTLRKSYIEKSYNKVMRRNLDKIGDKLFWFSVDETTDSAGRYAVALVIGLFDEEKSNFLVGFSFLEKVNNTTIAQFVLENISNLNLNMSRCLACVVDGASYMVKVRGVLCIM